MAEYIEREAFRKTLTVGADYLDEDTLMTVVNLLDCAPAADVAPVRHGRWGRKDHYQNGYYLYTSCVCSVCGSCSTVEYRHCTDCGARMDGDGNG